MPDSKLNDYRDALKKIRNSPKDRVGILGEVGIVTIGAVGGAAGASTVAAAAGATTLLGSSTLGGLLGGVFVAATPVGWVIGSILLGGATAYGISRLFKIGNDGDAKKADNIRRLILAIEELEKKLNQTSDIDEKYSKLAEMYILLIDAKLVDEKTVEEILSGITNGDINLDHAFSNCLKLLDETIKAS
jgi:hypothetical protein